MRFSNVIDIFVLNNSRESPELRRFLNMTLPLMEHNCSESAACNRAYIASNISNA